MLWNNKHFSYSAEIADNFRFKVVSCSTFWGALANEVLCRLVIVSVFFAHGVSIEENCKFYTYSDTLLSVILGYAPSSQREKIAFWELNCTPQPINEIEFCLYFLLFTLFFQTLYHLRLLYVAQFILYTMLQNLSLLRLSYTLFYI